MPLDAFDHQVEFELQFRHILKPEIELKEYASFKRQDFVDINSILPTEIANEFELDKFAAIN